jgi:hypothetical protein
MGINRTRGTIIYADSRSDVPAWQTIENGESISQPALRMNWYAPNISDCCEGSARPLLESGEYQLQV